MVTGARVVVGLRTARLFDVLVFFEQGQGRLWLQVVNPSRSAALLGLELRPTRAEVGDGDR
jgi:hypothetical protein